MTFQERVTKIFDQLKEDWKGSPVGIPISVLDKTRGRILT